MEHFGASKHSVVIPRCFIIPNKSFETFRYRTNIMNYTFICCFTWSKIDMEQTKCGHSVDNEDLAEFKSFNAKLDRN